MGGGLEQGEVRTLSQVEFSLSHEKREVNTGRLWKWAFLSLCPGFLTEARAKG